MGNFCTGQDQFQGETFARTLPKGQEIFIVGQVPRVTQNPNDFNDDDPIDSPMNNTRYGQNLIISPQVQRIQYNLRESVEIQVAAEKIQQYGTVGLVVSILTKEMQYRKPDGSLCPRLGMDIICVIDHSGSMAGDKEALARSTLVYMLHFLQPNDRLCLIMFDCKVYRLTRLMCATQENIAKFKIAISAILPQGGTDIGNAMKMALSVLKHRKYRNPVTAILLLSDGEDFEAPERVRSDLQTYNIQEAFTIKTFGFGRDVCPRIMSEIAHMKEGQFYFIPNLQQIDQCFVEALGGLVSVVANNKILTVNPVGGQVKMVKAYGDKWQYDQWKGVYTLYQPHLLCGIRKDYVFDLQMPPNGQFQVHVRLSIDPIDGSQQVIFEKTIQVNASQHDQMALENYYRVRGAECFDQAYQLAEQGQYQQAQQVLNRMQQQIQVQNFHDPMMDMLNCDLQACQQQCTPGQYQTGGRHNLTQLHVVHMYQKSRGVQIVGYQNGQRVVIPCSYQNNIQQDFKQEAMANKTGQQYNPQQINQQQQLDQQNQQQQYQSNPQYQTNQQQQYQSNQIQQYQSNPQQQYQSNPQQQYQSNPQQYQSNPQQYQTQQFPSNQSQQYNNQQQYIQQQQYQSNNQTQNNYQSNQQTSQQTFGQQNYPTGNN